MLKHLALTALALLLSTAAASADPLTMTLKKDGNQNPTSSPSRAAGADMKSRDMNGAAVSVTIPAGALQVDYSATGTYHRCIEASCTLPRPTGNVDSKAWMPNWTSDYITAIGGITPTVIWLDGPSGTTVGLTFWK